RRIQPGCRPRTGADSRDHLPRTHRTCLAVHRWPVPGCRARRVHFPGAEGWCEARVRRVALITGGSSGIGEAVADVFAAEGFDVIITARRADRLRAVQSRLQRQFGSRVDVIVSDLSQRDAPAELCEHIAARGVVIDALVNNAGYGVPGSYVASEW